MLFPHVLLMLSASPRMSGFIFQVSNQPPPPYIKPCNQVQTFWKGGAGWNKSPVYFKLKPVLDHSHANVCRQFEDLEISLLEQSVFGKSSAWWWAICVSRDVPCIIIPAYLKMITMSCCLQSEAHDVGVAEWKPGIVLCELQTWPQGLVIIVLQRAQHFSFVFF